MRRLILPTLLMLLTAAPAFAQTPPSAPPPTVSMPAMVPAADEGMPAQAAPQATPPSSQTPPAPAPRVSSAPRAPVIGGPNVQPMANSTNIRLDLVITDTYTGTPIKKSVSLLVLTGNSGMIRTVNYGRTGNASLDIDAVAAAYQNGMVSTRITFQYQPAAPTEGELAGTRPPSLNESITVVLMDGKPMTISQSADPATDRRVTAELTATILK